MKERIIYWLVKKSSSKSLNRIQGKFIVSLHLRIATPDSVSSISWMYNCIKMKFKKKEEIFKTSKRKRYLSFSFNMTARLSLCEKSVPLGTSTVVGHVGRPTLRVLR